MMPFSATIHWTVDQVLHLAVIGFIFFILYCYLYFVCNYNVGVFYHMFKCINPTFWLQNKVYLILVK